MESGASERVYVPAHDVLVSDIDDTKVLMSIERGQFVELNATGSAIWERLDGKKSVGEIVRELQTLYDIPQEACEAQVCAFLTDLRDHSLIAPVD
ncbi:PqqD family peptide modification chaperone [Alteriqipengyuania lutimaris]|uniref:PqqD family protein n=1 Tax=Alteriqipengyuania lutimaris TaxID=1538146 RepID=A0A395LID2_9SPHN|nr:PqqD family peptide modification chaperone [Alteriqipengyuania lutimaris]MBB3034359.1 hypothetical protein [Alteriqipengyuania lutimaris]RDS76738.1 PqqD family protein [Alteriqipengyuania lutimaris]